MKGLLTLASPRKLSKNHTIGLRALLTLLLASALLAALSGCDAAQNSLSLANSGGGEHFQVQEYAIIEESADGPNHPEFQQRVQAAVAARKAGWRIPNLSDLIQGPNETLAPFGYRLETNPTPPFSAYALYHNDHLIQRDITRFWPVSTKTSPGSQGASDFLLAFETMTGQRLVASLDGIRPWPGNGSEASSATPPVYFGDQIAYAQTDGSEVSVYAGMGLLYSGVPAGGAPASGNSALYTWGGQHWALEMNGHAIQDGQDLNTARGDDAIFQFHVLDGQPLYFYTKNGLTSLNYAGRDLPYAYDQVVHDAAGANSIFNPGDNGRIIWFYALRDGVWYYVEAGNFQ